MIEISTSDPVSDERVDVFAIDGIPYGMPKVINGQFALEVLEQIRAVGTEGVVAWMLEEAIGGKGYRALRNCKTLKTADLKAVIKIVSDHVLGSVEEVAGK